MCHSGGVVDNEGGYACVGAESMSEISVSFSKYYLEPKTSWNKIKPLKREGGKIQDGNHCLRKIVAQSSITVIQRVIPREKV